MNIWDKLDQEEAQAPPASGGSIWDRLDAEESPGAESSQYSPLESLAIGVGRNNPFLSEMGAAGKAGLDKLKGDETPFMDKYRKERDFIQHQMEQAHEQNPKSSWTGLLGGAAMNPGFRLAKGLKGAAIGGGLMGLGEGHGDLTKGELPEAALETALGAGGGVIGHGVGKGIGAAAKYIGESPTGLLAGKALGEASQDLTDKGQAVRGWIGKKFGKGFAGMPEHISEDYLNRRGKIEAPEKLEILSDISHRYQNRQEQLTHAKDRLNDARFHAHDELRDAQGSYNQAVTDTREALKNESVRGMAPKVQELLKSLKDKVTKQSAESYAVLEKSKRGPINIAPVIQKAGQLERNLKIEGKTPYGKGAEQALGELAKFKAKLREISPLTGTDHGDQISLKPDRKQRLLQLPSAKQLIQFMDKEIEYQDQAGGFSDTTDSVLSQLRHELDHLLGEAEPKYKFIMKGQGPEDLGALSTKTALLKFLSKHYGKPELTAKALENLAPGASEELHLPKFGAMDQVLGSDVTPALRKSIETQKLLSSPSGMAEKRASLPEAGRLRQAMDQKTYLSSDAARRALEGKINPVPPEPANLAKAQEAFRGVKQFPDGSVEAKSRALLGARPYHASKLFDVLDKSEGTNFKQQIKDRGVLDAFQKGNKHGSRNVQLFSKVLAGALGGGAMSGGAGAASGAALGAAVDEYAGPILKFLFDGSMGLVDGTAALKQFFGPYAKAIAGAAMKGPESYSVMGSILAKDPEFVKMLEQNVNRLGGGKPNGMDH